ncbi:MAG: threonine/serine exporter family protein [Acidobacteriota bacterium]|nr:threonine/serine exporter family protein [Acidobacteriota bacterium]
MEAYRDYSRELARERDDAVVFTLRIALSLQRFGLPSHRLEETMTLLDRHLGLDSRIFSSPTALMATFGRDQNQRSFIFRPPESELNLEKLDQVFSLAREVAAGGMTAGEGLEQLEEVVNAPDRYGAGLTTVCFVLSSAGAARLFGGGWREVLVSSLIGLLVGVLIASAGRVLSIGRILVPLSGIGAMVLAKLATLVLGPFSLFIATVTGLIVLLPGLTLTTAVTELAQGNAVSGTSRFAMASITFLMIAFGIALGGQVDLLFPSPVLSADPLPLPIWTGILAQILVPLTFVVLFKAHHRDSGWVFLAGIVAFQSARLGAALLGPQLGTFAAAFLLALFGYGFARWKNRPSSITIVPGIMLLVPGSLGYRSLQALLNAQTLPGLETAFQMMLVAVALVAGLIFAGIVLPPRSPIPAETRTLPPQGP